MQLITSYLIIYIYIYIYSTYSIYIIPTNTTFPQVYTALKLVFFSENFPPFPPLHIAHALSLIKPTTSITYALYIYSYKYIIPIGCHCL